MDSTLLYINSWILLYYGSRLGPTISFLIYINDLIYLFLNLNLLCSVLYSIGSVVLTMLGLYILLV